MAFDIRIWHHATQQATNASFTLEQGELVYQPDGILEVVLQRTTAIGNGPLLADRLSIYPNPTRSASVLKLSLAQRAEVQVDVFTLTGQRILPLMDGPLPEGLHEVKLRTATLAEGMYYLRVSVNGVPHNISLNVMK